MTYDEFVGAVAELADLPRDKAEAVSKGTLKALADRITSGEAEDIAEQLPHGLKEPMVDTASTAERIDLEPFVRRVKYNSGDGLTLDEAARGAWAVFRTLERAIGAKEWGDMLAQLPDEFREWIAGPRPVRAPV